MRADFYLLQEVGGDLAEPGHWQSLFLPSQGGWPDFVAIVAKPPKGLRCQAVLFPATFLPYMLRVHVGDCSLLCKFRIQGAVHHVMSAHLPHANRHDSEEVATQVMHDTFQLLHALRYFDSVTVGVDLNLDLQAPCDGTNRSVTLRGLVREGGLLTTSPSEPTWYPPANSPRNPSRIDYIWCAGVARRWKQLKC